VKDKIGDTIMNTDKKEFYRLLRRCERLTEELTMNAPDIIVRQELRLIKDACEQLLEKDQKPVLSHVIEDNIYHLYSHDGTELISIELTDLPNNQIVLKTTKEVYAGPIDFISFSENIQK
jgi:hypothetical protein